MAKTLPTVTITGKTYFIDERLCECRNVNNPNDRIPFRLIAAAPELLAAAEFLRNILQKESTDSPRWDAVFSVLDETIAKAKGE